MPRDKAEIGTWGMNHHNTTSTSKLSSSLEQHPPHNYITSTASINTTEDMQREDIVYFGAGPAALPTDVLKTAAAALQNYDNTGL